MTVVDVEESGDQFTIFDNGALLGQTSTAVTGSDVGECISCALADPNFSRGSLLLGAGVHNLTGVYHGSFVAGDGDFRISSAVPEPSAWTMMITGLASLGGLFRSRRKSVVAA